MARSTRAITAGLVLAAVTLGSAFVSGSATAAGDATPPTSPRNLRVQSLSSTEVTLVWEPSTDNSGWHMYTVEILAPGAEQRFGALRPAKTFTRLVQGATYTASVLAVDAAQNQSARASTQFTVPADRQPPTAPRNLRATNPSSPGGFIEWDLSSDDSNRLVYIVSAANFNQVYGTFALRVGVTEILGTCLIPPGSTQTITVRVRDVGNNLSPPSNPLTVTFPR